MYILGVETSCDETAAAVVKDGRRILSSVVYSSLPQHRRYGGIIPEIASRMQLEAVVRVADEAVARAKIKKNALDAVAVTKNPGLFGSLVVGTGFAKASAFNLGIPVIPVDHLYSHAYACVLNHPRIKLPAVALIVSGGHTSLYYVPRFTDYRLLGQTNDDACGEAFDKVAKILGLGYPGGPAIEKIARSGGPKRRRVFACSNTANLFDFSFSGIKTAILYYVQRNINGRLTKLETAQVAASFQDAVIKTLVTKSLQACRFKKARRLIVGGGVAANEKLRAALKAAALASGIEVFFPAKSLCMDNAAMVAGLGYHFYKSKNTVDYRMAGCFPAQRSDYAFG